MDAGLLKQLGINQDQVVQGSQKQFPSYFDSARDKAQTIILNRVAKEFYPDPPHWAIPEEQLHRVFESYSLTGNWRKTNRQLGICRHGKKEISINFGHVNMTEEQCYRTIVHEYIHALQYLIFNTSGHDKQFWFYLHLCVPTLNKHLEQRIIK